MADDNRYPEPLAARVGFLLARAHLIAREKADEALVELGLSMKGYAALATLVGAGPMSQLALSRRIGMDPATMVDVIDTLETGGHVRRRRNQIDRRAYALQVTPKGQRLFRRAEGAVARAESETLGDMSSDDRLKLMRLLGRIAGDHAAGTPASDATIRRVLGRSGPEMRKKSAAV